MVEFQGQSSNRNTVKPTVENGQKMSSNEDTAGVMSLVPGIENSELRNGVQFDQA